MKDKTPWLAPEDKGVQNIPGGAGVGNQPGLTSHNMNMTTDNMFSAPTGNTGPMP